jgi:hypothetical protein
MPEELGGPYVQIAAFCQTALAEGPGAGAAGAVSIIRILDRIGVPEPREGTPGSLVQVTLVIILKSGFFKGRATVTIRPRTPGEQKLPPIQLPFLFEGEERGVQVVLPMAIMLQEEGLYWFEVSLEDSGTAQLMTQVPLRVLFQAPMQQPLVSPPRQ